MLARPFSNQLPSGVRREVFVAILWTLFICGGTLVSDRPLAAVGSDDLPAGPRAATWKKVEQALMEGKPKTAAESLAGVEQAAIADKAWAEAARAIATRILAITGDRPADDPERLILLAKEIEKAPVPTRGLLEAVRANWTWGFFLNNRWRFSQRTSGGSANSDLASIASWDLPQIVAEIRARFAVAVNQKEPLQKLPIREWSTIIPAGTMADAYRPTVWDVVVRDAIAFTASGERGLVDPEDVFEMAATSPALGTLEEFLAWQPQKDGAVTDLESPLLQAIKLYRELLAFHRPDRDRTALLAADLDRILWASGAAVGSGEEGELADRKIDSLEAFVTRAGDHETAALAQFHLATTIHDQVAANDNALVEARAIAAQGLAAHPASVGGKLCKNLIAQIDMRSLSITTERQWAAPWPTLHVSYKNLATLHLRVVKADWLGRLKAGKPHGAWLDDADRGLLLKLPAVKEAVADLPATPDYRERSHQIAIEPMLDAKSLAPGAYWVLASQRADFGEKDNVVSVAMVWVSRLAIVADGGQRQQRHGQPLRGHVVDIATGEPVANATVKVWVRDAGGNQNSFTERAKATTNAEGRYEIAAEQNKELLLVVIATIDGREQQITSDSTHLWQQGTPTTETSIVLVTDRGIHRPGQIVFYKGIASTRNIEKREYAALANQTVEVILRDANGREVARKQHITNAMGSLSGNFPIPTGALPGQWSIVAQGAANGGVGVRVEEYKRPKFLVTLKAPEKAVTLGGEVSFSGTATTYTGIAVANAQVKWRIQRERRFPEWCRGYFPWLPIGGEAAKIARGTALSDANGAFTITFVARPDRSVPPETSPIFTYVARADVTDPGGETRSAERRVSAGYTNIEASLTADSWQQVGKDNAPATVAITLTTLSLDGQPQAATGTLTLSKLVQPATVARGEIIAQPRPLGRRGANRAGAGKPAGVIRPKPSEVDAADPETWAAGESVFSEKITSDPATGKVIATPTLSAGLYRAEFEIPSAAGAPAVRARHTIEVIDSTATRYAIKRAFALRSKSLTAEPGSEFQAIAGTGYETGRALIEILQEGETLSRFWTQPGQTQWPVSVKVRDQHRGGFTVRAWIVRDGRLHLITLPVDVPWTNKKLVIAWQRFTRRVEPATQEVWRATITSAADPLVGPAAPALAEMVATLYDQSLDAINPQQWPTDGLLNLFHRESSFVQTSFSNRAEQLNQIRGHWDVPMEGVAITYRELRDPFGPPNGGFGAMVRGLLGGGGGGADWEMKMMMDGPKAAGDARPMLANGAMRKAGGNRRDEAFSDQLPADKQQLEAVAGNPPSPSATTATAAPPPPRRNMAETAFFLPTLVSDQEGVIRIEFVLPDTLTTWQFKGLAHDAALRSGVLLDTCVAAKDLMVEPLLPRFLREGDVVEIPVKVSNRSTGRLTGTVTFSLSDARTGDSRDGLIQTAREQPFDLAAGESKPVVFTITVADGTDALLFLATGTAGKASDGEEAMLPVLSRRVLVSESLPLTIRGPGEQRVSLARLAASAESKSIVSQSLVVQAASNPAWYAVLALPCLMEETDESTESLFTRLYANSFARHIATSDPQIARVFEQWKGTDALQSPLEKNTDLVKTLLAETPWVRDAVDEREARSRIALLFDSTRAANETAAAIQRLGALRHGSGGWPWFPGGQTCDSVTLSIVAGFGRLRASGVPIDMQPALATLDWLDGRLIEWKREVEKRKGEPTLSSLEALAIYARSFFTVDVPPQGEAAGALAYWLAAAKKTWMKLDARSSQGQAAIALFRSGDRETALSIVDSLRQRAVGPEEKPGEEKANWQGMWWRDPHPAWWNWACAPIETQAVMIETFDEVAGDKQSVEGLKAWLLSQKRTSRWRGNRATANAVGALLGRGDNLLASQELVSLTVGGEKIVPGSVEAGTGFFETRLVRREITPKSAEIVVQKPDAGLAWGGIHWQYLDDIANVPAVGREELAIEKKLFVKRQTKAGAVLEEAAADGATKISLGDELVVRLVVTSDRDYEFLELADHRPSLTEPVDVLSGWRWADGAGWYVAVRDASTQFFFERLPRGTHVFEYSLRAAHRGTASSGFATIQSRYAPEFSAHSESVAVEVK